MIAKHYNAILFSFTVLVTIATTGWAAIQEHKEAQPTRGVTTAIYIPLTLMFDEEYQANRRRLGDQLITIIAQAGAAISDTKSTEEKLILKEKLAFAVNKLLAQDADVNVYGKIKLTNINMDLYGLMTITTTQLMTPLHLAAIYGLSECAKTLIDAGANINLRTKPITRAALVATERTGKTALHLAAGDGRLQCVKLLVEANADVEALDNGKNSALQDAIDKERLSVIEYLLEMGAHLNNKMPNNLEPNDKVTTAIRNGLNRARTRPNWMRVAPVIAFHRANKQNLLKNSILDLMESGAFEEFITGVPKKQIRSHATKITNKYNVATTSPCTRSSSQGTTSTSSTSSTATPTHPAISKVCVIQ